MMTTLRVMLGTQEGGKSMRVEIITGQDDAYSIPSLSDAIHTLLRKGGQPGYIVKGARSTKFINTDRVTIDFCVTPDVGFIRRTIGLPV